MDFLWPKWKSFNPVVRQAAIEAITDQALLIRIAKTAQEDDARVTAVKNQHLADQAFLTEIATSDASWEVRTAAVENPNLTDQKLLAEIAKANHAYGVGDEAAKKLTDQTHLADVSRYPDLRIVTVARLTDPDLLAWICRNDERAFMRQNAIENPSLADQQLFADIALKDKSPETRRAAVRKLTEPALLCQVATFDKNEFVRNDALGKLADQTALAQVASTHTHAEVRNKAVWLMNDRALLAELAQAAPHEDTREVVSRRISVLDEKAKPTKQAAPVATPAKMKSYRNQKWNLAIDYPEGWHVLWENEPDGGWEIVVGIASEPSASGRSMVSIRVLPHAVLNLGPENVEVLAAGGQAAPSALLRTPEEYNARCIQELASTLL